MLLRRCRWTLGGVGKVLSRPGRGGGGGGGGTGQPRAGPAPAPGPGLHLHQRPALPPLLLLPPPHVRLTVTWSRPGPGSGCFPRHQACLSRRYGAGKPAPKRQAAEPCSYPRAEERAAAGAGSPELYENPWTIPNLLCMARIGLSPYLGYLIVEEEFNLALGLFTLAGITDLLDGYIARNWANQKSALGSALDPLADKILISVLYVSLTCVELIPAPLTVMVLMRDVILVAAGFYIRYRTVPAPRTLSKYFNPCYATAQLKPTFISKVNTAVQLVLVAASLAAPVFQFVDSVFLHTLWYVTALTTVASAYSYYLHGKNTVQVLNRAK
ncbi:cardiolipin synthase (CMP-forming) [Amblyraja radiata]|uniref:cardiolipin synthase (CMP-forming) n=1 Tax=Amblyraja radiata TaxID=386614 RepID=UPI0014037347|nr:cardiolipin synthase (CMP-forming) [Amblyraja radiata]